jgi:peptide-methionine (R)-S-oxide reductase
MSDDPNSCWQDSLSPEEFRVTRCGGTEAPFTGRYWNTKTVGTYQCVCCEAPLFASTAKYESGSGWPSFWQPLTPEGITERRDVGHGMVRVEVLCAACDGHLGHLFPDGPPPTGQRYCINSASLKLIPSEG